MKLDDHALNKLLGIKWFSSIGKPCHISDINVANSSNEAGIYLSNPDWENVTLEESNKISGYLAVRYADLFQEWNKLAKEAKAFWNDELLKNIPNLDGFDNVLLLQCIEWDVIHYLIEDAYKGKLKKSLFFDSLICIYESGHIPCGWDGVRPNGNLVVY